VPGLVADFRELRAAMQQQGLFNSSKVYYVYKLASTLAILGGALVTLVRYRESNLALVLSAFLLGLFWQQSGWLAHDFLHHQVGGWHG
jgi:acyl-lipid Delta6-acetylenase / acyl-lipid (9-3)-desaturase